MLQDPEVFALSEDEKQRQNTNIDLIASANVVSRSVLEAMGSFLTNKVAEGYPGRRYFSGCEIIDKIENLAINRAKQLFGAEYVNVQPYSGTQANHAVFLFTLKPGDRMLAMDLNQGGHLSHGAKMTLTGKNYDCYGYGVDRESYLLDYDKILQQAKEVRPKLIIAGASAYPRIIDFKRFRAIADEVGALFLADIAHIAGLIAAKQHPSPIDHAHFVTTTTQKTMRGPRGGMILMGKHSAPEFGKKINSTLFPGVQGAIHMNTIAAKAVMLKEALDPAFVAYHKRNIKNAQTLAEGLITKGFSVISGGTDNHIVLLDLTSQGISGKEAEDRLTQAGICVNKNLIPYDQKPPKLCSGIRLGTSAVTTRGFNESEIKSIVEIIDSLLSKEPSENTLKTAKKEVSRLYNEWSVTPAIDND